MKLNDNKAGMEGLDRERINQIIYETSKGKTNVFSLCLRNILLINSCFNSVCDFVTFCDEIAGKIVVLITYLKNSLIQAVLYRNG